MNAVAQRRTHRRYLRRRVGFTVRLVAHNLANVQMWLVVGATSGAMTYLSALLVGVLAW